jgi:enoyl-CoA hydratase
MAGIENLQSVQFERVGNLAIVTLNRPQRLNALDYTMHRDVVACWDEINDNPEIRAAVITGNGRFFCAGRDIKEYLDTYGQGDTAKRRPLDDPDDPMFARLCNHYIVKKPLVGALNGPAVGGGLEITLMCDMVVMAEDAYIADLHAQVNVSGMNTLLWFLPPMIARQVTMTDRRLTAQECLNYGLVNQIVSRQDVREAAIELAQATTVMGPDSIQKLKEGSLRLQRECGLVYDDEWREARRRTIKEETTARMANSNWLEGMKAFAERREAKYSRKA